MCIMMLHAWHQNGAVNNALQQLSQDHVVIAISISFLNNLIYLMFTTKRLERDILEWVFLGKVLYSYTPCHFLFGLRFKLRKGEAPARRLFLHFAVAIVIFTRAI